MGNSTTPHPKPLPQYRERLVAPPWTWLVIAGAAASAGIVMVVAFGWYGFLTGAAIVVALGVWWVTASTVTIAVTDDALAINDAHLDWPYVGLVATLDEDATRLALSREADPRAFVVARTLAARSAVTIEVLDDEDPHPYWLVTTAHPQELANAIVAARDAFRAP